MPAQVFRHPAHWPHPGRARWPPPRQPPRLVLGWRGHRARNGLAAQVEQALAGARDRQGRGLVALDGERGAQLELIDRDADAVDAADRAAGACTAVKLELRTAL